MTKNVTLEVARQYNTMVWIRNKKKNVQAWAQKEKWRP